MGPRIGHRIGAAGLLTVLTAISWVPAHVAWGSSRDDTYVIDGGFRAGVVVPYISINGDFDGRTAHVSSNAALLLPEVDPAIGFGLAFGYRDARNAYELNYQRTRHDATLPTGRGSRAVFETCNLEYKRFFYAEKRLQPYVKLGWIPYARLAVADGSANLSGAVGKGKFSSLLTGFNLGIGVEYFLTGRVSLCGEAFYRRLTFEEGRAVDANEFKIKDAAHGVNALAGVSYGF